MTTKRQSDLPVVALKWLTAMEPRGKRHETRLRKRVPYTEMEIATETKLILIAKKARENKKLKFTSLMHHLNFEYLEKCYEELKQGRAAGIDGRSKESYTEEEIKGILQTIIQELKERTYRPDPVKRVYIEKPGQNKKRPLGLPTVKDKILQMGVKKILEAIWEANFLECSWGYRPKRNAHGALKEVNHLIMQKKINYVIDADIQSFFDTMDHQWLMEFLTQRISDPHFKSLIWKFLESGILESGTYRETTKGTPQGGIVSPLLANIYLHYVLDVWFYGKVKKELKGEAQLIRYADDFIIGFQYREEAQRVLAQLKARLAQFQLKLSEEKTRIIEFGRFAEENAKKKGEGKPMTFDFLGFTHYCSRTRDGRFKLGVKTSKKSAKKSFKAMNDWFKSIRNVAQQKQIWETLKAKLTGHYEYYGISGNFESIYQFYYRTERIAYKWLNRRSQKKSFNWESFRRYLERYPLPRPELKFQIYNTW